MENDHLLKRYVSFWISKSPLRSILFIVFAVGVIGGLAYGVHRVNVDSITDFSINLLASLFGFGFGFLLYKHMAYSLSRHEDEQKVCYDDQFIKEFYGSKYYHVFDLPKLNSNGWPGGNKFRVYADKLFVFNKSMVVTVNDHAGYKSQFQLDSFINDHYMDILEAHGKSVFKNDLTVRLNDVHVNGQELTLWTTRSTYVNNLLTNRAIDYKINGRVSLRELFENRTTLTPLRDSKMSNHIGVNVLVFLGKGKYILFPERDKTGTIAKGCITASWATRFTMEDYAKTISPDYVIRGVITQNLKDMAEALMIEEEDLGDVVPVFLGATRDIYEGGKPTFFYLVDLSLSLEDYLKFTKSYQKIHGKDSKEKNVDAPARIYAAEWESLHMNAERKGPEVKTVIKRNERITFNALNCSKKVQWKKVEQSCEKNLIAGFYILGEYEASKNKKFSSKKRPNK